MSEISKKIAWSTTVGLLRNIDYHFALFIEKLAGGKQPYLQLAAALVSQAVGRGHICLPLVEIADREILAGSEEGGITTPDILHWREALLESGVVGGPDDQTPLILDLKNRLYMQRYFCYEKYIANDLLGRTAGITGVDRERAYATLNMLFPQAQGVNLQKLAAAVALSKKLVIISGGPGTGKTFTVARILAALQDQANLGLRIALAAPTGKAAARLAQSIRDAKVHLPGGRKLLQSIPDTASTLHRLLGTIHGSPSFRFNTDNPLLLDLLVIDEASMIDVPLMTRVLEALPHEARLILLGDRDQLASVEAGSLFANLCERERSSWSFSLGEQLTGLMGCNIETKNEAPDFDDSLVLLEESYRFSRESGIGALATAVNNGNPEAVEQVLTTGGDDLVFRSPTRGDLFEILEKWTVTKLSAVFSAPGPQEALASFEKLRILCALRSGPTGVREMNTAVERALRRHGLIKGHAQWYMGRPIMITSNQYGLRLFNGDVGIIWPDDTGKLQAWFSSVDGKLRSISPSRLGQHETAYAITIHKSQGSEYDQLLLVLPHDDTELLTRELIYTGITRAKITLELWVPLELIKVAITRRVRRHSGLADRLWKDT